MLVTVCLLFLMVSLVGYVLKLWLFLEIFYTIYVIQINSWHNYHDINDYIQHSTKDSPVPEHTKCHTRVLVSHVACCKKTYRMVSVLKRVKRRGTNGQLATNIPDSFSLLVSIMNTKRDHHMQTY